MAPMKRPRASLRPRADRTVDSVLPADLVRALPWLRQRLDQPVRIEELAQVAGVRPRTLESHFRTFLGTTPLGWVRRTRLHKARQALVEGDDRSITEAALANGSTSSVASRPEPECGAEEREHRARVAGLGLDRLGTPT